MEKSLISALKEIRSNLSTYREDDGTYVLHILKSELDITKLPLGIMAFEFDEDSYEVCFIKSFID